MAPALTAGLWLLLAAADDPLAPLQQRAAALLADPAAAPGDFEPPLIELVDQLYADATLDPGQLPRIAEIGRPLAARAGGEFPLWLEFELAGAALQTGALDLAATTLTAATANWPDDAGLRALAAELAMTRGDWERARLELDRGEGAVDPQARALLLLQRVLFDVRLGRADRALLTLADLRAPRQLDPQMVTAAALREFDLWLLADRPADALAALDALPPEFAPRDLALRRAFARAELPDAADDRDLPAELLRGASRSTGDRTLPILARLAAAELEVARGDLEAARGAIDAAERELARRPEGFARERALAAALRARVDGDPAAARLGLDLLLAEWRATPLLPGGVSFLRSGSRRVVVHEALEAAPDAEAAYAQLLATQSLGSLARRLDLPTPTLAEIRHEFLARGEVLLHWFSTRAATHLFIVEPREVRHLRLPPEPLLVADAAALAAADAALATAPTRSRRTTADEQVASVLRRLTDRLLPGMARDAMSRATFVRLVAHDLPHGLPLHRLQATDRTSIGEMHALCELPSLPVALWLRRRPPGRHPARISGWLGPEETFDGSATFGLDRDSLTTVLETLELRDAARDGDPLATPDGDALMLVAHGVIDRRRDRFAGLLLAHGLTADADSATIAWADAFERAALPPLVVLAACSAGEAPTRVGEDGGEHLGGAALMGGARSVLLAHGTLDAADAVPQLVEFLRGIEAGRNPAVALREARRRERPRGVPPGFVLLGLGDEPLRPEGPLRTRSADRRAVDLRIGAAALLLAGLGLLRRSRERPA